MLVFQRADGWVSELALHQPVWFTISAPEQLHLMNDANPSYLMKEQCVTLCCIRARWTAALWEAQKNNSTSTRDGNCYPKALHWPGYLFSEQNIPQSLVCVSSFCSLATTYVAHTLMPSFLQQKSSIPNFDPCTELTRWRQKASGMVGRFRVRSSQGSSLSQVCHVMIVQFPSLFSDFVTAQQLILRVSMTCKGLLLHLAYMFGHLYGESRSYRQRVLAKYCIFSQFFIVTGFKMKDE